MVTLNSDTVPRYTRTRLIILGYDTVRMSWFAHKPTAEVLPWHHSCTFGGGQCVKATIRAAVAEKDEIKISA